MTLRTIGGTPGIRPNNIYLSDTLCLFSADFKSLGAINHSRFAGNAKRHYFYPFAVRLARY